MFGHVRAQFSRVLPALTFEPSMEQQFSRRSARGFLHRMFSKIGKEAVVRESSITTKSLLQQGRQGRNRRRRLPIASVQRTGCVMAGDNRWQQRVGQRVAGYGIYGNHGWKSRGPSLSAQRTPKVNEPNISDFSHLFSYESESIRIHARTA